MMMSRNVHPFPRAVGRGLAALLLGLGLHCAGAEDAPVYRLSIDAYSSMALASEGFDPRVAASAAVYGLGAELLHRVEAPGWGLVLSHNLDLSGTATAAVSSPTAQTVTFVVPTLTVYEAYARLDLGTWGQLFVGKRRMGLGIGTTFAPGDLVDPRSGFWDQKSGFRGLDFAASLGSDYSVRAALGLDRNFDAYAAVLRSKAPAGYSALLDGAAGPADPRLFVWALSTDAQFGALQASLAAVFAQGDSRAIERPSLGLSYDLGGLILQAEGAVEFAGAPDWYGTAGARYAISSDAGSLTFSIDYDYNGAAGLLRHTHYLLPWVNLTLNDRFTLYARALVELEAPSALLSTGLTLYPVQGFDLEFTALFGLGAADTEFARLPAPPVAGKGATVALGLGARAHF